MKKMVISGSSDDCRDILGDFHEEEYQDVAKAIRPNGEGFYIIWSYSEKVKNACWSIGFCQLDEDIPIPEWAKNIRMDTAEYGYSVRMCLEVPDDVQIIWEEEE